MTGVVNKEWSIDYTKSKTDDLLGKNMIVIGGTNGLGRAIAILAAEKGAAVTVVGRKFQDESVKNLSFVQGDLSSMKIAKEIGETICSDNIDTIDTVLFTNGILAKSVREESAEGLEMDMAVSYLSRLVLIKYLAPRLKKGCRIFNMGYPGMAQNDFNIEDLNSEKSYSFTTAHMTTVVGNEALVHVLAADTASPLYYYGLNPGLIKTGIRDNVWNGGNWFIKLLEPVVEGLIGLLSDSAESYAKKMIPLLFYVDDETETENIMMKHNGALFNPKGQPVLPTKIFTDKPDLASEFIKASITLIKEKTGIELQ